MEKSSSTSSSSELAVAPVAPAREARRAGALPWGIAWAIAALLVFEIGARSYWTPLNVGAERYAKIDATYGYGYDLAQPLCLRVGADFQCFASQYLPIAPERFAAVKAPNTARFITLGGSLSFGQNSYTPQAVRRLKEVCPGVEWQGVNFSVQGMGTSRMRILFEDAFRYEPDFIVIDPVGSNEYEDEIEASYRDELHRGIWALLLKSRAVVLGQKVMREKLTLPDPRAPKPVEANEPRAARDPATAERWFQTHRKNLAYMVETATQRGIPVVVMGRGRLDPKDDYIGRAMAHWPTLAGQNVTYVPVDQTFSKLENQKSYFTGDRNHYTSGGHGIIAGLLAGVLSSKTTRCAAAR